MESESLKFWKKICEGERQFIESIMKTQDFMLDCLERRVSEDRHSDDCDAAQKFARKE